MAMVVADRSEAFAVADPVFIRCSWLSCRRARCLGTPSKPLVPEAVVGEVAVNQRTADAPVKLQAEEGRVLALAL